MDFGVTGVKTLPPKGMFRAGSFSDASRNTYDLMTQTAEYGL